MVSERHFLLATVLGIGAFVVLALPGGARAPAIAADLMPVKAQPQIWDWTGFYLGAYGGYAIDTQNSEAASDNVLISSGGVTLSSVSTLSNNRLKGGFGGLDAGYNWQISRWVVGVEGDISFSNLGKDGQASQVTRYTEPPVNPGDPDRYETVSTGSSFSYSINTFATLRARLGFTWDRLLIYGTGGFAFADASLSAQQYAALDTNIFPISGTGSNSGSQSKFVTGWTLGGGVEGFLTQNWTARLEYQYVSLPGMTLAMDNSTMAGFFGNAPTPPVSADATFQTLRAGVNYKF